ALEAHRAPPPTRPFRAPRTDEAAPLPRGAAGALGQPRPSRLRAPDPAARGVRRLLARPAGALGRRPTRRPLVPHATQVAQAEYDGSDPRRAARRRRRAPGAFERGAAPARPDPLPAAPPRR